METSSEWGPPAVEFRGVSKRYGDHQALHPLDISIREGEFFCLLGPSGCGKTTTLNLLGGFVAPTDGEISLRGERIDRLPPHRRPVNTVFQSYALFPHMTVRDNVGFGLKMAKVAAAETRRRVDEALTQVGLEQFADRRPAQLSGGQQQRVAVARALVNRPAVLILDEPLGALDLKLRKRLQLELSQIHREVGTTFVYVTHDQEEAMAMGDRIAVMNEGRVEQVAAPADIYLRPASRFVAEFIGESNFLSVGWDAREGAARLSGPAAPAAVPVAPEAVPDGATELHVMIRPECVHLARDGAPGLAASVLQTSFLGDHARVTCAIAGTDQTLVGSFAGRERTELARLVPGEQLHLTWDAHMAVLFDHTGSNITKELDHVTVTHDAR